MGRRPGMAGLDAMTRDHHEQFGIPSNARYRRHAYRVRPDVVRTDPAYDRPAPQIRRRIVTIVLAWLR